MIYETELQSLQNFADNFGLTVKKRIDQDKRKKTKYWLIKNSLVVSNSFTYNEMNIFLLGIQRAKKFEL